MRGRMIKPNHSTRTPGAFIAFDTETHDCSRRKTKREQHRLQLGCAKYWRNEKGKIRCVDEFSWTNNEAFWQWVRSHLSKHRTTWIWSHNLGFDLTVAEFWTQMTLGNWSRKWECLEDFPVILSGGFNEGKVVFCDLYNFFQTSLAKIAKYVGREKGSWNDAKNDAETLEKYCRQDVDILADAVNGLCSTVRHCDLGVMKYTFSGQSFAHWRHMSGGSGVIPPSNNAESRLAREAYHGGRTECFFLGDVDTTIYELDVNQMYAWVMTDCKLPKKMLWYSTNPDPVTVKRFAKDCAAIAWVELEAEKEFPVRISERGTVYALGSYWTCLAGRELFNALYNGMVVRIGTSAAYECDYICKDFASYWIRKRREFAEEGNAIMEQFAKQMPNSLYGKFAQCDRPWIECERPENWPDFKRGQHWDSKQKIWVDARCIAGKYEYKGETGETEYSFPAISAFITAAGRMLMDQYRRIAGHHNVFYQCVDSLHVNTNGYINLLESGCISQAEPGMLKECNVYKKATYWGLNLMRLDGKMKASGLPGIHKEVSEERFEHIQFERLTSILARDPDGTVRISHAEFKPNKDYRHGVKQASGWTRPMILPLQRNLEFGT